MLATKKKKVTKKPAAKKGSDGIRPVGLNILVVPDVAADKAGSIVLPESAKRVPNSGFVHAKGAKVTEVSTGQKILFAAYAGTEIDVAGVTYKVMREDEILAIL